MEKVKLSDICSPKQWKTIPTSDLLNEGYPVYGANGIIGYYNEYNHENPVVTVTCRGATCGSINITVPKAYVTGNAMCLDDLKNDIEIEYLYYCLKHYDFKNVISGSAQPQITRQGMDKIYIMLCSREEQRDIVNKLKKTEKVIKLRKQELQLLDDLVKARFVEMFGDPVSNPYGYDKVALSDLADIKIGPFGSLLHKEDYIVGGHPLLNPSHIVDGRISPDNKLTISDEKYKELSAYQLKTGDVVMGRRGEMGRCAVVSEEGFLCGTGSILIRTKGDVTADYIQKTISFPSFKKTIEDMAVGQTMPNLNVPIVSSFEIIKPPIEVQDRYYALVEQVNKSKVAIQKALNKTQMLFDSLMQEYFG
ncbi:restriction endonuclease subunit S [Blautia sp. HCP3S3_C12]|uniref:restriction endonuclease subunit S n=1 Tax=unclassified Blautia TaxID=2648079 RepID=UPI003F8B2746